MGVTAVSIIGGGRWARTIAGVMASLPSRPDRIVLHSRHNASGIADWIAAHKLQDRMGFSPDWPDFGANKPDAVVVANRATDHVAAAAAALAAGVPVLVEKPVAIGADAVRRLSGCAPDAVLAAGHVFLFTRYLEALADLTARHGAIGRLDLTWQDGQGDFVRGEVKSYDPAVTVFDDVLPHVLPMLARLHPAALSPRFLTLADGGAQVTIGAMAGDVPVSIRLARNAAERRRVLTAETEGGICTLDFSTEPGVLSAPGIEKQSGDPLWDSALRPLGSMLATFLETVRGGALDTRLSPEKALTSAVFADAVREPYRQQQRKWLEERNAYALLEISNQV
jgi:predicted dehydrogenase